MQDGERKIPIHFEVKGQGHNQGSFWGAILQDSPIFFCIIALILLQCKNSRNINIEASRIELDSFRVDFVLFQWNLRLGSVWVNGTLPVWFRSVNWQDIDFLFLWRPKKFKVSLRRDNQDSILPMKQPLLLLFLWGRNAATSRAKHPLKSLYFKEINMLVLCPNPWIYLGTIPRSGYQQLDFFWTKSSIFFLRLKINCRSL